MKLPLPLRVVSPLSAGLLLTLLLGCTASEPTGTVSGSIRLKGGAPVTEGMVNFISKERGIGSAGPLDAQGTFRLTEPLPVGRYTVFIPPPLPAAPMPGVTTSRPPGSFSVPAKYHNDLTSDLQAEVKAGENSLSFELLPSP